MLNYFDIESYIWLKPKSELEDFAFLACGSGAMSRTKSAMACGLALCLELGNPALMGKEES